MHNARPYPIPPRVQSGCEGPIQTEQEFREATRAAKSDPDAFWLARTKELIEWQQEPTLGVEGDFSSVVDTPIQWFSDGILNVTESCVDRHAKSTPNKTALLWEADNPRDNTQWSYSKLLAEVCRAAGALTRLGVKKGDRVIVYMGMVPQAAVAMLACARIGAIHSVVFGGFSADAIRDRVLDCDAHWVITQDVGIRGKKRIPLKHTVDEAIDGLDQVKKVLVFQRSQKYRANWSPGRDVWWHEETAFERDFIKATPCRAEDPLFILYTSGSTGKPKGVVHTCGGYITYTSYTHRTVFDLRADDVYACVADVGWITGHSYIVYGPLANGATTLLFESLPTFPNCGRYWEMVERHKITIFYTAPTAIRTLAAAGDHFVQAHDRSSLRVLGTVGEPINPEAWAWYNEVVGEGRCTIVDTWWQTETGGICISPIAPITQPIPGAATTPLPGIVPVMLNAEGEELEGPVSGLLALKQPWPGQARTVWGDHERFAQTYFAPFPGFYFTGDGARRDSYGRYWITGRVDDVMNVSGHRMGTAEFESQLVAHSGVAEAAVVGYPHEIKGEGVCAYIVMQGKTEWDDSIQSALLGLCRKGIGAHAKVDRFIPVPGLPKTRSGKVMRRILRKIAHGQPDQLGDTSTLADPSVVEAIKLSASDLPEQASS